MAVAPLSRRRMLGPALLIGGLGLVTIALHLRDPHAQGSWGFCPSAAILGIYCPGCGGLRAVNDLTNLRLVDAASSNLLFVAFVPVVVFVLARWSLKRWQGEVYLPRFLSSEQFAYVLIALMAVFTVLRNLSPFDWLAP